MNADIADMETLELTLPLWKMAREYAREHRLQGRGGYVLIWRGKAVGWMASLQGTACKEGTLGVNLNTGGVRRASLTRAGALVFRTLDKPAAA